MMTAPVFPELRRARRPRALILCNVGGTGLRSHQASSPISSGERTPLFRDLSRKRDLMPAWMELLINLLGYAGFLGIATFNSSPEQAQREPQ